LQASGSTSRRSRLVPAQLPPPRVQLRAGGSWHRLGQWHVCANLAASNVSMHPHMHANPQHLSPVPTSPRLNDAAVIGEGGFGRVFRAMLVATPVAIKAGQLCSKGLPCNPTTPPPCAPAAWSCMMTTPPPYAPTATAATLKKCLNMPCWTALPTRTCGPRRASHPCLRTCLHMPDMRPCAQRGPAYTEGLCARLLRTAKSGHSHPPKSLSHNADAAKSYPMSLDGSRSGRPRDLVTTLILIHDAPSGSPPRPPAGQHIH
jgi:hypothetical protein